MNGHQVGYPLQECAVVEQIASRFWNTEEKNTKATRLRSLRAQIFQSLTGYKPFGGERNQPLCEDHLYKCQSRPDSYNANLHPQKALRGGIPGDGFGIWGRFWSHFVGNCCQKLTNLSRIDFEILPRRALRG